MDITVTESLADYGKIAVNKIDCLFAIRQRSQLSDTSSLKGLLLKSIEG
jgi:hypothetical protein